MKLTTITYRFTQNLGNYQSRSLEITAEIEDTDPDHAFETLKDWIGEKLQIPTNKSSEPEQKSVF